MMSVYLKSVLWDFLLCILAATPLCYTIASCFFATQGFQNPVGVLLMGLVSAAVVAALLLITRNTKSTAIGSIVFIIACIAILALCASLDPASGVLDDQAGNAVIPALLFILTPLGVFALSRRRKTTVILLVVGVFICAVVEYLYWYGHLVSFLIFLVGAIALLVLRTYQKNLLSSESETTAFGSVSIAGLALGLIALLCAGGLAVCVIAPLGLPHANVKLITEHYRIQQKEVQGSGSTTSTENLNIYSNRQSNKTELSSNDDSNTKNKQIEGKTTQGNSTTQDTSGTQLSMGKDDSKSGGGGGALSMQVPEWVPYVLIILVILLIVGVILAKKALRKRRFKQMTSVSNALSAQSLYLFFLARLVRIGFPAPGSTTLKSFSQAQERELLRFENNEKTCEFSELTNLYLLVLFGSRPITDQQLDLFEKYYRKFYKRIRAYVGTPKYCLLFFLI